MTAKPSETLEEYVERFQYNLQRSPYASAPLPDNVLKNALIRGMKDQWVETLNLMGKGDIYQESYPDIVDLCIRCSRGNTRLKSICVFVFDCCFTKFIFIVNTSLFCLNLVALKIKNKNNKKWCVFRVAVPF